MNVDGQNWFPYLAPSWLTRLVELIRRSVPSRVTIDWCLEGNRFSFTRANASQFIRQLVTVGWLDEDGALTPLARNLRLQGDQYQKFIEGEIGRIYDELLPQFEDPAFDRVHLETYFTAASNLGLSGRRQVIATFKWFVAQAGLDDLLDRIGGPSTSSPVARAPRARRQAREPRAGAPAQVQIERNGPGNGRSALQGFAGLSGVTLSITLQLPTVDDEKVYAAIFKAMREYLLTPEAEDAAGDA